MRRWLWLVALLLVAGPAWAQPVYDNATTARSSPSFTNPLTMSHTTSGTNRCLFVFGVDEHSGATTIASATYGGVAMTAGAANFTSAGSNFDGRLFYLALDGVVAAGAANVVVTLSDGNSTPSATAVSYTGCHQTTPASNFTNATSTNATPSWTLASATGDLVVAIFTNATPTNACTSGTTTVRIAQTTSSFRHTVLEKAGAGGVTIDCTKTGDDWWGTAFSVKAAGGGGGGSAGTPRQMLLGVGP